MTGQTPSDIAVPALRLGVVPYLNVQPLIYGLDKNWPALKTIPATPAELERMLARDEIDLGILPVVAAFLEQDRAILPATVIASPGPVHSVVIAANQPIDELNTVFRDPNSMTSNALAAVLIDRIWSGRIGLKDCPEGGIDNLPDRAGRIIIGDTAVRERGKYPAVIDLAQAWTDWTGLPFVFAAWIGQADIRTGGLRQALEWTFRKNQGRIV